MKRNVLTPSASVQCLRRKNSVLTNVAKPIRRAVIALAIIQAVTPPVNLANMPFKYARTMVCYA